ncbi:MAG: formylglycine-generating enzyme family protein [Desulfocucumaceae bacterium]
MRTKLKITATIMLLTAFAFTACGGDGGGEAGDGAGDSVAPPSGANLPYTLPSSISFNMKYVPGGIFPTGIDDLSGNQTISTPYWMAETEVTYELWYAVRTWARANGYTLNANPGREGNDGTITAGAGAVPTAAKQEPVTTINWREAMVWCNALTEYYNANNGTDTDLDCVYYTDSGYATPIRAASDSTTITWDAGSIYSGTEDEPFVKSTAKGFRLPGSMEWECAARYRGTDTVNSILSGGIYWTKGNSASGAIDYAYTTVVNSDDTAGETGPTRTVAWYVINGGSFPMPVMGKIANALGLYDMSGNVWEWCFDWYPGGEGVNRVWRGGSCTVVASYLRVGDVNNYQPYYKGDVTGFRFARTQ